MKLPQAERCASIPNMKILYAIVGFSLLSCPAFAQQKPQPQHKPQNQAGTGDRLGMTCAQILAMNSTDWIAKSVQAFAATGDGKLRGIRVYGRCYDERTDQLAAALARKGTGPKKTALANLKDFQIGMDGFTAKTLADTEPAADPEKIAYAGLYEKQFRYEFYEAYEQKALKPPASPKDSKPVPAKASQPKQTDSNAAPAAASDAKSANLPPAPKQAPLTGVTTKKTLATTPAPPPAAAAAPAKAPEPESATKDVDPFTKAKNHFGELLGLLPVEKMHEVHSAFGKLFSGNPLSEDLKVEVYEYAIFLLERPSDKPFAPPPF
jgi:hypothetical protein